MKSVKIKDIAKVITGGTPSTSIIEYWENGNIPWLNSGELNKGIINSSENYITKLGLENSVAKLMPPNTVLIALTGATTGVTALLKIEACANQSVTGILPSDKHIPEYLYYFLSSLRQKILRRSWGGAQKHINQEYVKNIQIPLPSLSEQKQIAESLDKVDEVRQKRKQSIRLLDDYIKSVFYDMFNGSKYPYLELKEVSEKITDGVHLKPSYTNAGIPFISVKDITTKKLIFDFCKYISIEDHKKLIKRCKPEYNDILYTKVGATYGRACIVDTDKEFSIYVSVSLIKPKKESINSEYLKYILNSDIVKRQADKCIKGIGVPDLHLIEIQNFSIPIPPLKMQYKFSQIVQKVEKTKSKMEKSLKEIENLFNSLMQKYFNNN